MTTEDAIARLDFHATQHETQAERLKILGEDAAAEWYALSVEALRLGIRALMECQLAYGELNKALGGHAPKAWDRIKAALDG